MFHDECFDPAIFRTTGHQVIDLLSDYLQSAQRQELPVLAIADPDELLAQWQLLDGPQSKPQGSDAESLVELLQKILAQSNHLHHPGYVGHQVAVPIPAAALIECVNALLNNGMAVYEMGQVQTIMETNVVDLLCQKIGLPKGREVS